MKITNFFKNIGKRVRAEATDGAQNKRKFKLLRNKTHKKLTNKVHYIKAFPLLGLADIPSIQTELKEGNIVILNISQFIQRPKNKLRELKRAVDQLSYISKIHNGEMGQLGDNYILMTPCPSIKIWKEKILVTN